ncbi:hypothetical protein HOLleu_21947 [Holothuria leucospilota]|uniref:Uncharacterized protein n=1 Tax=Holothuria leucospilota TaxID=206669 RepID=A0A9Q1H6F6_HOLLE|nr:hypothetical protein HOLleu_21947 [Holothuria leucospilota]
MVTSQVAVCAAPEWCQARWQFVQHQNGDKPGGSLCSTKNGGKLDDSLCNTRMVTSQVAVYAAPEWWQARWQFVQH